MILVMHGKANDEKKPAPGRGTGDRGTKGSRHRGVVPVTNLISLSGEKCNG